MKLLLSIVLLSILVNPILSQEKDSLELMNLLDNFEIIDQQSSAEYYQLLQSSSKLLTNEKIDGFYKKGVETAKKMGLDSMVFVFSFSGFNLSMYEAEYNKALNYALMTWEASKRFISKEDSVAMKARSANMVGIGYYKTGDYFSAIKYYTLAVDCYKKSKTPEYAIDPLYNLALIHKLMGDHPAALKYYQLGYPLALKGNALEQIAMYVSLANTFMENVNQPDSANLYRSKSLETIALIEDKSHPMAKTRIMQTYLTSVHYFVQQERWDSVQFYLNKALPYKETSALNYVLYELDYCLKSRRCSDIEAKYTELESLVDFESPNETTLRYLKTKFEYLNFTKKYREASIVSEELLETERELINQERVNYALYTDALFETTKKEAEIERLETENKLKQTQSTLLTIGLSLSLLLIGFVFYIFHQVRQKNKLLEKDIENKKLIEQQAAELEKSNQFKNRLFANISHEIRTPLTLINAAISRLSKLDNLTKKDLRQLQVAQTSSREVLNLTNQVLHLTKAERGNLRVNLYAFQFKDVVNFLAHQFQSLASNKSLNFEVKKTEDNTIELVTDADKLITVLNNLVVNAIKYTPIGGQIIWEYEASSTELICKISDTGQGIPENDIHNIFNRYFQSNENRDHGSGVGIGLAICKEYSEILRGTINVESEVGQGSVFTLTIPVMLSAKTDETPEYPFTQKDILGIWGKLPKQNFVSKDIEEDYILVVEDNIDLCHYYFDVLGGDYPLYFAHNGEEALRQIELKQPALVLTDWMMPGMNGKELITTLKQNKATASVPTLMVTAVATEDERSSLLKLGVDDYLTKPFQEPELKAHIAYLLDLKEQRDLANLEESLDRTKNHETQDIDHADKEFLKDMEQYVLNNIGKFDLNLEDISKALGVSLRQLHRKSKSLSGMTPNQYITEVRFREAKKMLEQGIYQSVKAVTYSVGFKAEKNFSRNFKKRFGKYPSEFLK